MNVNCSTVCKLENVENDLSGFSISWKKYNSTPYTRTNLPQTGGSKLARFSNSQFQKLLFWLERHKFVVPEHHSLAAGHGGL